MGLEPFSKLAKEHGAKIRPFVIPLIEDNGAIYSRNRPEARRAYRMKDLKRWAALRGKTLSFDNRTARSDPIPAGFMVIAAIEAGEDWLRLAGALQEAFWGRGEDIGNSDVRLAIENSAGYDGDRLETEAQGDRVNAIWTSNYETAKAAGVFGLPTFIYEDELYWGQDTCRSSSAISRAKNWRLTLSQMTASIGRVVSTDWLATHLGHPDLVILDGSFKLPGVTPIAAEDFQARHIPNARFFDIDAIADHDTALPHMLPSAESFETSAADLGLSNGSVVVVYDTPGLMSAGCVWWTLRTFGHDKVVVLDDGLRKWLAEGRPVTDTVPCAKVLPQAFQRICKLIDHGMDSD